MKLANRIERVGSNGSDRTDRIEGVQVSAEKTFEPVWLRSFLAVVNGLSFTKAAERLGISQPAVSQHVRRLEET